MRNEITRETKGIIKFEKSIIQHFLDLLWTAPELLRNGDEHGTKAGDIYAFAIICSGKQNDKISKIAYIFRNHQHARSLGTQRAQR